MMVNMTTKGRMNSVSKSKTTCFTFVQSIDKHGEDATFKSKTTCFT